MVDVKKLITGFLILATLSGSLAFVFSTFFTSSAADTQEAANLQNPVNNNVPTNAFTESVPANNSNNTKLVKTITDADLPPVTSSTNLTQTFANRYTRQLLKLNPAGPNADPSGGFSAIQPTAKDLTSELL